MLNLTQLESSLWEAADQLRANSTLNASEYSISVLGLIFLRYATNRYEVVRSQVEQTLPSRGGKKRSLTPADFKSKAALFLPETAHYDYLLGLPDSENLGQKLVQAVKDIEAQSELLKGVLPKEYASFDKALLQNLVRIFGRDELKTATGDVFGRIYEYFLNKFAMSGAQEGGEFFTPPSLVRMIVNVIEPTQGVVFDPACGSAGMFVQTGHFLEKVGADAAQKVTFYGQELSETNTQLAKMNLAVHGLDGNIRQSNTFYDPCKELIGACDYVMANPPFNVDMVDPKKIKNDERLFTAKKIPGISKKTETVSNANYLWIQYFYSYLKSAKGKAGFVMASSAADARHGEKTIRQELLDTGNVDIVISIGSNFFYTTSLPCMLWFLDKGKPSTRKDKVLMIDARNIYRLVSRRVRDFSPEQLELILATVWLYREQTGKYEALIQSYIDRNRSNSSKLNMILRGLERIEDSFMTALTGIKSKNGSLFKPQDGIGLERLCLELSNNLKKMHVQRLEFLDFLSNNVDLPTVEDASISIEERVAKTQNIANRTLEVQRSLRIVLGGLKEIDIFTRKAIRPLRKENRKSWKDKLKALRGKFELSLEEVRCLLDSLQQIDMLYSYFPDNKFSSVAGFCKVVGREEILEQESSLNPGRYVGVPPSQPVENSMIEKLRESVEDWNQWRERTRGRRPDLTGADLSNLYLKKVDLSNAILNNAIFDRSILKESILQGIDGESTSFKNANMKRADLREANLVSANIKEANLAEVNLYSADLRDAQMMNVNLKDANLSEARVLRTNFHGANLTGACIADWQIGDTTLLDDIECDHIFRKLDLIKEEQRFLSRLPVDRNNSFKAGEFSQRFQILQNASETIDLTFTEGINWRALFSAFEKVRAENAGKNISMQRLEQKGSTFVVSLTVDPELDIEYVDRSFNTHYGKMLRILEHDNKHLREANVQLQGANIQLQTELIEVVKTMSERDHSQTINNMQGSNFGGGFANTVQGNQTGGTVNIYGAKMEEVTRLLASLRAQAQGLPKEKQEAALDAIEDLNTDISKPNPDPNKVARRFKSIVTAFTAAGLLATGTAKFSGDVKDTLSNLSQIIDVEQVMPGSSSSSDAL